MCPMPIHLFSARPGRALVTAFALLAAGSGLALTTTSRAAADAEYSQHQPPPLCSQPHPGACVQQPHPVFNASTIPVGIDMPTMNRNSASSGPAQPTGYVTFVITQPAASSGLVSRPPGWAGPTVSFTPIPGFSTTGSEDIIFSKVGQ